MKKNSPIIRPMTCKKYLISQVINGNLDSITHTLSIMMLSTCLSFQWLDSIACPHHYICSSEAAAAGIDASDNANANAASKNTAAVAAVGIDVAFPMVVVRCQDYNMMLHKALGDLSAVVQLPVRLKDS